MSRVIAFILGMLFAIVVIGGAIVAAVTVVTPDMVTNGNASDYVGDFGKMSLLGMYNKFKDLYTNYTGKFYKYVTDPDTGEFVLDENGRKKIEVCATDDGEYFTLGMLCATTGIDLDKVLKVELPQSVYSVPLLEYFNGSDGVNNAMSQIKVSTVPDIVNLFSKTDESGKKIINQAAIDKLAEYSLTDLLADNGIETVFAEIKLSDILSDMFPSEQTEGKELMYAVGQATVGKAIGAFKSGEILPQVKLGGAFEEIGKLKVTQLVDSNETIQNIFGDTLVRELVNDEGKFDVDKLLDTTKIGGVLGYEYDETEDQWYKTDSEGNKTYAEGIVAVVAGLTIRQVMNAEELQNIRLGELLGYIRFECETDGYTAYGTLSDVITDGTDYAKQDGDKWYVAKLVCDETHEHASDCFDFVWKDANGTECDGVLGQIASMTIGELQNADALNDKIQNMKLGDVMTIADDERPLGALKNTKIKDLGTSFKQLTLGDVIEITDTSSALLKKLKNEKLGSINQAIDDLTINDVIEIDENSPKLLRTLSQKNTKISELGTAMNDLKLSDVIDTSGNSILNALADSDINNLGNDLNGVKMGTVLNYAYFENGTCTASGHDTAAHWHESETDTKQVSGIYAKIADMTISEINSTDAEGNSGLEKIMLGLTLGDLVDSGIMDLGTGDALTQNEYKLRIMTCNDSATHSFVYLNTTTFQCNLAGFFSYKAALQTTGGTCTAEEFYNKAHGNEDDRNGCMDLWKNVPVKDFMSELLSGF